MVSCQRFERAMPQPEGLAVGRCRIRRESNLIEQLDQPLGLCGSRRQPRSHVCHRPAPARAGLHCFTPGIGRPAELLGQNAGELPVRPGVLFVGSGGRRIAKGGPTPADRRHPLARGEARSHELVEMLPDRVRVEAQGLGQLADLHRACGLAQYLEDPCSARRRAPSARTHRRPNARPRWSRRAGVSHRGGAT